ncbi:hypothetical protein AAFF_G00194620 [Aldrovandia affinis]|uniref:Fibronectin type-III domain-containing protein n=1 Tax=Aldrovandia affinis TaxID=143900 RepID=A0AAD7SXM0_9TELE|nr:hypothetical protein AAFF_G00194620 [Aldrovandia affinis]
MLTRLLLLLLATVILVSYNSAKKIRGKRQNMKVRISATDDTIILKFLRHNPEIKLEGYILGYGSSMFSKQFIQLPENGEPYETEIDAEPKYLVAVQPIPTNNVKKQCTGKVSLEKPLHIVIGSVSPTTVILSWGTLLKTPYEGGIMKDCLEDGNYTVRYRERHRKWNYQTCPTSDTVIDNLRPDIPYEFAVKQNKDEQGVWSKPVIHSTNLDDKGMQKPYKPKTKNSTKPGKPIMAGPHVRLPSPNIHNRTQPKLFPLPKTTRLSAAPRFPLAPPKRRPDTSPVSRPSVPQSPLLPLDGRHHKVPHPRRASTVRNIFSHYDDVISVTSNHRMLFKTPSRILFTPPSSTSTSIITNLPKTTEMPEGQAQPQLSSTTQSPLNNLWLPRTTQTPLITLGLPRTTQTPLTTFVSSRTTQTPLTTLWSRRTTKSQLTTLGSPRTTQSPQITFGSPSTTQISLTAVGSLSTSQNPQTTFGSPSTAQSPLPTLGSPRTTQSPQITFGLPSTTQGPLTTFGSPGTAQSPLTTFGSPGTAQSPLPTLGSPGTAQSPLTTFGLPSTTQGPLTTFGSPGTAQSPLASFGSPGITQSPLTTFGSPGTAQSPLTTFGSPGTAQSPLTTFGSTGTAQSPLTTFGSPGTDQSPLTTFGSAGTAQSPLTTCGSPGTAQSPLTTFGSPSTAQSPLTTLGSPGTSQSPQTTLGSLSTIKSSLTTLGSLSTIKSSLTTLAIHRHIKAVSHTTLGQSQDEHSLSIPSFASERANSNDWDKINPRNSTSSMAHVPQSMTVAMPTRNPTSEGRVSSISYGMRPHFPPSMTNSSQTSIQGATGERHKGLVLPKPVMWPTMLMDKANITKLKFVPEDKVNKVKKIGKASNLKPHIPTVAAKLITKDPQQTTAVTSALNSSRFDIWDNSSVFSPVPFSKIDSMGKQRFLAPHVVYKTDKKPDEPCSITNSLSYFPEEEGGEQNVTAPPKVPPSNLTVMTVEGCPSFIILDWERADNETTDYEVTATAKGPEGEKVSILTTNQTHTAVENLKPDSSYEFKVKPVNEYGEGPSTEAVAFNTESADPRVSENVSGKDAIWTQFPFKSDAYSECNGRQYVKRTWYRKFVGIQLCNSLRYKIYLSDSLTGKFYNIGDQTGYGEDHCQFVDSFLDGRTGSQLLSDQLPLKTGFYRAMRQQPVSFGQIGGNSHITYVPWYECGTPIPGKW